MLLKSILFSHCCREYSARIIHFVYRTKLRFKRIWLFIILYTVSLQIDYDIDTKIPEWCVSLIFPSNRYIFKFFIFHRTVWKRNCLDIFVLWHVGYFNAQVHLVEEREWYYETHGLRNYLYPKCISSNGTK